MGIVCFPLSTPVRSALLAPVQALVNWLMLAPLRSRARAEERACHSGRGAAPAVRSTAGLESPPAAPPAAGKPTCHRTAAGKAMASPCKIATVSRLKIVREFDATMSPASAGRMMISGRMADVCAELERLTQFETASH